MRSSGKDFFQIPYDPDPNDWEQAIGLLQLLRPARQTARARLVRHLQLGSHPFTQSDSLNSRRSTTSTRRITIRRIPTSRSPPPGIRPPITRAPRPTCARRRTQQLLRRPLLLLSSTRRDLFGLLIKTMASRRHRPQHHGNAERRALWSSTSPIICKLGRYVTLYGGERISSYHAGLNETADLSAHRRNRRDSAPALGLARLLRPLLPARAACRPSLRPLLNYVHSHPRAEHVHAAALRTRRRAPVRSHNSVAWMDRRRQQFQEPRQQLPRSRQRRRVQHVLPHRRRRRSGPLLGNGDALTADRARRPVPPRVLQPDRRAARQRHRRIHVHRSRRRCLHSTAPTTRLSITISATPSTPVSTRICRCTPGSRAMCTTALDSRMASRAANVGPYNGPYLPAHTTFDSSAGHSFGERLSFA